MTHNIVGWLHGDVTAHGHARLPRSLHNTREGVLLVFLTVLPLQAVWSTLKPFLSEQRTEQGEDFRGMQEAGAMVCCAEAHAEEDQFPQ